MNTSSAHVLLFSNTNHIAEYALSTLFVAAMVVIPTRSPYCQQRETVTSPTDNKTLQTRADFLRCSTATAFGEILLLENAMHGFDWRRSGGQVGGAYPRVSV